MKPVGDILSKVKSWCFAAVIAAAGGMLPSCADSEPMVSGDGGQQVENADVTLIFNLSMDNTSKTRAWGEDDVTEVGKPEESAINSAWLMIENAIGEISAYPIDGLKAGANEFKIDDFTPVIGNTYTVYLGVNLSEEQVDYFCEHGNSPYTVTAANEEKRFDLVEEFAPGFASKSRNDIAMFCVAPVQFTFEQSRTKYSLGHIDLKRLVAKVLVTTKEDPKAAGSVIFKDGSVLSGDNGWMHVGDVNFLVNAINKEGFLMQIPEYEFFVDPNYKLVEELDVVNGVIAPTNANDFYFNSDPKYYNVKASYMQTPVYEERRMPRLDGKNSADVYRDGIYCTENTFDEGGLSESRKQMLADYSGGLPMITHVTICAKYTPRRLRVEADLNDWVQALPSSDFEVNDNIRDAINQLFAGKRPVNGVVTVDAGSEELASLLLSLSLRKAGYRVDGEAPTASGLPRATYYAYIPSDKNGDPKYIEYFCTYGAAKLLSKSTANRMELGGGYAPYVGGRGYYCAYVDNRKLSEIGSYSGYKFGSVERNVYYILTINSFSTPGSSNTASDVIDVYTQTVGWKLGGTGHVTLE